MHDTHATEPARTAGFPSRRGAKTRLARWARIAMASAVATAGLGAVAAPALADSQGPQHEQRQRDQ
jgi:hypothetical protein